MLHIHYGRERLNKDQYLFEHIQGQTLLIVPDQYTLQAERDAFFYLGKKGFMDLDVVGISRLSSIVLAEVGGGKRTMINKQGRHMLLTKIMAEENQHLQVYKNYRDNTAFIDMVNNFISELKQFNVAPDGLHDIIKDMPKEGFMSRKLTDIHRLYTRYEELIQGKFTDTEDYISLFIDKIKESTIISNSTIWIVGFDSFTPKNLEIIQQLRLAAKAVHVIFTWDKGKNDSSIFEIAGSMIKKLNPDNISQIGDEYAEKKNPAIASLETQLFAIPTQPSDLSTGITLVSSANIYAEAETAAGYILHLIRDKGLFLRDILVICNDLETRGSIYKRVFAEYGLDLFMDNKRDIMHSPVVNYILALLDILGSGYRTEDVFRLLKTGLGPLSDGEVADLQNYVAKYKIRGSGWKKDFKKGVTDRNLGGTEESRSKELKRLNQLRHAAISPILSFGNDFKEAATVLERVQLLYDFLSDVSRLPQKIEKLIGEQQKDNQLELAQETEQIWNITMENLDQLVEILGGEKLSMETFAKLLTAGFESVEVGILPPALDGLMMGTMQRTRSSRIKAMVVMGANEGVLPADPDSDSILNEDEKQQLLERGIELCKVDKVRSLEEKLAIYRNLSKASDYLWVGYAASDDKGTSTRPSPIYEKIREIFPNMPIEKDVLNRGEPVELIQAKAATLRHLTTSLREAKGGAPLPEIWKQVLGWYMKNDKFNLDLVQKGLDFNTRLKKVDRKQVDALYKRDAEQVLSLSPSRLERFARCPFAYFVKHGMRPADETLYEVGPLEMGDLYHRCLMVVSTALTQGVSNDASVTDPNSLWMTVSKADTDRMVLDFINQEITGFAEGILESDKIQEYRTKRICAICQEAVWRMIGHVRKGEIVSMKFEEEFGSGKNIAPIQIIVGDEKVLIEGKIDRFDLLPGEKVKIIDYKSGTDSFSEAEATSGWKLQLMVYLRAAMEGKREPAGAFYFHIQDPVVDGGAITEKRGSQAFSDKLEDEIRKCFMMDGAMVGDPDVVKAIAGDDTRIVPVKSGKNIYTPDEFAELQNQVNARIDQMCTDLLGGNIGITPLKIKDNTACKYCEYKGICMFDNRMEGCYYILA
jgi:ATP-dependent helicase/nuclease subunit B